MDTLHESPKKLKRARAYSNIALIKYWGKWDKARHLPYNSSLSITLDALYTETSAMTITGDEDIFYLNGQRQSKQEEEKITSYLNKVRSLYNKKERLSIISNNYLPTAAGLASSASGYAALAQAISLAYDLRLSKADLSRLARLGSVSAARSIYGGFVSLESKAELASPFMEASDYAIIIILINDKKKSISSRQGMENTVKTSPYYEAWVRSSQKDFEDMKEAILAKDFTKIGQLTEESCMKMHATTMGARPPFTYLLPESINAMNIIYQLRRGGDECYFTIDAGPNVKVLCKKTDAIKIKNMLANYYEEDKLILAYEGPGCQIIGGS